MASNIKLGDLGTSAGLNTATTTVSGSYVATTFLTGSIGAGVRDLPDTPGTLTGTSARPYGQQYEFIEFDGKLPTITIDTLTSPDTSNSNSGKQVTITYTVSGVLSGESYTIQLWINGNNTTTTYSGNTNTQATQTYTDSSNSYIVPNSTNTVKLILTITSSTKTANDSKTVYVYPVDLTITSITQSPSLSGATSYNYTTGSIAFTASVAGGISPYIYNWNSGASSSNPFSFDNSSTTTDTQITLVVTDSHTPTADTANGTGLPIMRRPVSVSISNASVSEPYVDYTLDSTVNYNVQSLAISYVWNVASGTGYKFGYSSTNADPIVYYTSTGSKTHRVNITSADNASVRNHTTSNTTVQVSPTSNVSLTYTTSTETWASTWDSVTAASYGSRTYDWEFRSKDSGGSYSAWSSTLNTSNNSLSGQSFSGKTANAQYIQIRIRVRRTYSPESFNEVSSWVESAEVLVPQKGVITMSNQTSLLTGGDRSFDGNVTIGGVADTSYTSPTITAVSTGGTVTASVSKPSSNIVRVVVNNPCTNVNDGTASHVITLNDGNGYVITKSFTTQYKISSTSINLTTTWGNGNYFNGASNSITNSLAQYSFTLSSFAYKVGTNPYTTLNGGSLSSSYSHSYTAPTADQTWTYRIIAGGGTYTNSDTTETSLTVYGYPNQSYGYSAAGVPSSGTLSQVGSVVVRVSRNTGDFVKISVNSYYVTRPTGTNVSPSGKSEASISDSATSFDSDAFSLYDSAECGNNVVGSATLIAYLKYAIDASKYYLHQLTASNISVTNEPGSLTATLSSGITSNYAIRGNNIIHNVDYVSYGPPIGGYYDLDGSTYDNYAFAYISQNTDPSSFSGVTASDETAPVATALGYYGISTNSTYCRKSRTVSFGYVPTAADVGTTKTLTFYGREYRVDENYSSGEMMYLYNFFFSGDEPTLSASKSYTVRGRRLTPASCSWNITIYVYKGTSEIQLGLGSGTLTGPDGAIDYYNGNLDALTYQFQRWDGSNWIDMGSSYDPGTFGSTRIRVKFTDTWGNVFATGDTANIATTEDYDYTFSLYNENSAPTVYGYVGPGQTTAPVIINPSSVSSYTSTTFSTGTGVTIDNLTVNTLVVASEHDVSGMDSKGTYSTFGGAYTTISVSVTAGSTPTYGMFRTFNYTLSGGSVVEATVDFVGSPYAGISSLTKKSFQMFNSNDTTGNNTYSGGDGNWKLMALLRAPSVYGATATYTLHGQKSSSNTQQGTDYYIVLRTRSATNNLTFTILSSSCGTMTVRSAVGQIDTANKLIVQKSTNNVDWTEIRNTTPISANTNYDDTINSITGTMYVRAFLYNDSTLLTTATTLSFSSYAVVANDSIYNYSTISLGDACTTFSYRVDRPAAATGATNNSYRIDWYTSNEYGDLLTLIATDLGRSFNTTYTGNSLDGFPCDTLIAVKITPYSSSGCVGSAWYGPTQVIVSDQISLDCNCSSGGNGCLVYGTLVEMGDGTFKKVEDLEIGEIVKSLSIKDLDADIENNWKDFYTADFEYEEGLSIITDIFDDGFTQYYIINDNLKLTFEHPVFIKRAEVYMFTQTENLVIGDYIFKDNGEFELVSSIDIINENVNTININIEENDVYFANGILVHNAAPGKG